MKGMFHDLRYAVRQLRRSPGFTVVAVLTLALGIGANTAIFSIVDSLFLRPLPVHSPSELTFVAFSPGASNFDPSFSVAEFHEISERTHQVFSEMASIIFGGDAGPSGRPDGLTVDKTTKPVQPVFVSGNFFQLLGIHPYLGRLILPSEGNMPGADPVVVLSYRYWKTRFNSDPDILNKPAMVDGRAVTIVGIAPEGFLGITPIIDMEAYLPLGMALIERGGDAGLLTDPRTRSLLIVGRLLPGTSIERANASLAVVGRNLIKAYPRTGVGDALLQARELKPPGILNGGNPVPKLAGLFLTLSALVLALACLNVANLSLVRATGRWREIAVRAALGGTRGLLIRHLLTESALIALFGSVVGITAGTFALRILSSLPTGTDFPVVLAFPFNGRIFIYSLIVAMLTGLAVGIVPALRISNGNLSSILHEGGRTSTGRRQRMRTVIVAGQAGGSLALLIVAGLFLRSMRHAQHADLGFDPQNVLNVRLDPGELGYAEAQDRAFYDQLVTRVRALPGVQSASLATTVPLEDNEQREAITIPGSAVRPGEQFSALHNSVSPDYFKTMSIALLKGEDFSDRDNKSTASVAIINQAMAARFWPGTSPVGHLFTRASAPQHAIQVIGVARNSRIEDTYSSYGPAFYLPISQNYASAQTLQIRTNGLPKDAVPEVLAIIQQLAPAMPVLSVRTMTEAINGMNGLFVFNLGAELTGTLGLLGLTLGVIGIYGVMAYAVGRRTHEIGVRIALGAKRSDVLWMICRQGLVIIAAGIVIGCVAAMGIGRLLGDFLVGVGPTDLLTYSSLSLLLTFVALAACFIPARRAANVDPIVALRYE
jgi:putative ABC transport system permease protein